MTKTRLGWGLVVTGLFLVGTFFGFRVRKLVYLRTNKAVTAAGLEH